MSFLIFHMILTCKCLDLATSIFLQNFKFSLQRSTFFSCSCFLSTNIFTRGNLSNNFLLLLTYRLSIYSLYISVSKALYCNENCVASVGICSSVTSVSHLIIYFSHKRIVFVPHVFYCFFHESLLVIESENSR